MNKLFLASQFYQVADKLSALIPDSRALKVAFIPTAADTYAEKPWMEADRDKLVEMGFEVEDYDLKGKVETQIYNDLKPKDIIFVSGGNTFYLLYHIRQSGFDKAILRLLDEGKVYIGSSAGSMVMCPTIEPAKPLDNAEQAPLLTSFYGLHLVDFVILPHYGKPKYEQRYQDIMTEWSSKLKLQTLTDEQVVIVVDGKHTIETVGVN